MPKSLPIKPEDVRKPGMLEIPSIPINQYKRNIKEERKRFGDDGLIAMLHDMIVVREFETMLNTYKTMGSWEGIPYSYKGPAHLSIGQEAAVVGQAAALEPEDFIFGSHRSHGEILSKCLSAARKMDEPKLISTMESWLDGETLSYAKRMPYTDAFSLARNFIIFGTLAEIFARKAGFNRGMG